MSNKLKLRSVPCSEEAQVRRLAASRAQPARLVQRANAKVIEALLDDPDLSAQEAGFRAGYRSEASGPKWVRRFNEGGPDALEDRSRPGRPVTHDQTVRSKLLDVALQKPRSLGLPFALWTLERLQTAFHEQEGTHLATSTIWQYIEAEGLSWKRQHLSWKRQQSWFHDAEKHDERFAEKRGPS